MTPIYPDADGQVKCVYCRRLGTLRGKSVARTYTVCNLLGRGPRPVKDIDELRPCKLFVWFEEPYTKEVEAGEALYDHLEPNPLRKPLKPKRVPGLPTKGALW